MVHSTVTASVHVRTAASRHRSVQPEMWQMKKTGQPLSFSMSDVTEGVVELWNRNHYTNASRYAIRWELKEDDKVIQSGDLALSTAPLSQELVHIPYKKPALIPGKEYRLMLHAVLKKDELWAKAGHEVAWEELELPWSCHALRKKRLKAYLPIHFRRKN